MDISELSTALANGYVPDPSEVDMSSLSESNQALLTAWLQQQQQLGADQFNASLVQTIGGLIGGIGQAKNQRDMMQYQQQLTEQLAQWQRQFTQSGDYWGATVGISPTGKALTRPNGDSVYGSGGLISNRLGGR